MNARPHLHVEFIVQPVENLIKSREQGRPIFEDKEFCRIRWVGDNKKELVEPAHQQVEFDRDQRRYITYAEKFSEHYKMFKAQQDQAALNGTPIAELPFLTESKRAELRALNIHTAENLASLDGANLQRLGMGGRELKNQAQAWIDKANGSADFIRLAADNEALKTQLADMQAQIRALSTKAPEPAVPSTSPFTDWDDDTIRLWIKENGGEAPHHKCSHATLVMKADDLNAALAARKAA